MSHMTPLEMLFAVLSILALGVCVYCWRDADMDSAVLSVAKVNGPRRMIADNNIRQEQLRLGISLVMVLTSWSFLYLPPPPPDYSSLPQSISGLIGWITVCLMVLAKSLADLSLRRRLQRYSPIEVQTQSRTVPAIATNEGVMEAAREAREEQRLEDAEQIIPKDHP